MLLAKPFKTGDINGTIYDFEHKGDKLDEHTHDELSVHITIVCRGKLKATCPEWVQEADSGQIINFKPNIPHELEALEDGTRVINIVKKFGGVSNDYVKTTQCSA